MPANCSQRTLSGALLTLAAIGLVGAMGRVDLAEARDLYFPATTAYNRHNYDPFDQATPAAAVERRADDDGETKVSSEIRLIGSDPIEKSSPKLVRPVVQPAMQAAPPAEPEPLPMPPSAHTQPVAPEEPGADWSPTPLADLSTNIALPSGLLPRNYWSERTTAQVAFFDPCGTTRGWPVNSFNWVASCLCHNPLYFEEANLERYGYGCCECVQPAVSAAHFFATVPALPYMMAVDCPGSCDYTLGHYRPGSCPPWRYHCCTRVSCLGALSAGGVATGLVFLIP